MNQTLVNIVIPALLFINMALISYCIYKKSAEEFTRDKGAKKTTFSGATTTTAPVATAAPTTAAPTTAAPVATKAPGQAIPLPRIGNPVRPKL
jgi:hypothetical protein